MFPRWWYLCVLLETTPAGLPSLTQRCHFLLPFPFWPLLGASLLMRDTQFRLLVFLFHLNEVISPKEPWLTSFPCVLSFLPPPGPLPFFLNHRSHVLLFFQIPSYNISPNHTSHACIQKSSNSYNSRKTWDCHNYFCYTVAELPFCSITSCGNTPEPISLLLYIYRPARVRRGNKSAVCHFFIGYLLHLRLLRLEKKNNTGVYAFKTSGWVKGCNK